MLIAAVVMYLLVALAFAAFAAKFTLGPVPADYHQKVFDKLDVTIKDGHAMVIRALYQVMSAGFVALALGIVGLALFGVWGNVMWAKVLVFVVGMFASVSTLMVTRNVEIRTGVRTPWRVAAFISVLLILAFLCSMV